MAGTDPPTPMPALTEANGFLPGAVYQPTGPLVDPPFNSVAPYNSAIYKGAHLSYSGDGNPGNWNEYFTIDEAPEHLLVFVTGAGVFDIDATWTKIKPAKDDYTLSGPLLLRSSIPGNEGKIHLSGNDDFINALGFNVVQEAQEPVRRATVRNAHTGETVLSGEAFTGNLLVGSFHSSIDLSFDPMAGMKATWNDTQKEFVLPEEDFSANLHLASSSMELQVGANEGEDMGLLFGNMSSKGLGLLPPSPLVLSRELAASTTSKVDASLARISRQRSRLGAYTNRLEHTISNLTTASQNMTASESQIKDVDMAKEMTKFMKLNILSQAGTSILAQANQKPESVLQLLQNQ